MQKKNLVKFTFCWINSLWKLEIQKKFFDLINNVYKNVQLILFLLMKIQIVRFSKSENEEYFALY